MTPSKLPVVIPFPVLVIWLLAAGCSGHAPAHTLSVVPGAKGVSAAQKAGISTGLEEADDDPTPDLKTVLADYHKECGDTVRVDTTLVYEGSPLQISFRHYSTNDSLINLPLDYIKAWGLRKFVTHDFESSLRIAHGDSILLDTVIRSNIFRSYAPKNVAEYGSLFDPELRFLPDGIQIDYSYSIVLTDLGVAVHAEYLYAGHLTTTGE